MSCEILFTVFLNAPAAIRNGNVEYTPGEKRRSAPPSSGVLTVSSLN